MKKLFNFLVIAFIFSCNKNPNQPESENKQFYLIDIYHGTISLGPKSYWYVKFYTQEGDSVYFEAIVNKGNDISYAFWCDSVNFERWKNNQNAQLRNYKEAILNYSFNSITSKGTYYIVLGNSAYFDSKIYWARGYKKGLR